MAGFVGIPLALVLLSWYSKYAFILFDHIVRGFKDTPALDIQMVNPVDEQRPLALVGILVLLGALIHENLGGLGSLIAAILGSLLIPACVAVLARYLFRIDLWQPLQIAFALFAGLSVFCFLAGTLYERRDEVGLEVWHSPEIRAAKIAAAERRQDQRAVDEAYSHLRTGQDAMAWSRLTDWLARHGNSRTDYEWLRERVGRWGNPLFLLRLDEECIERMLSCGANGQALGILERALRQHAEFRPKSGASTLRLAHIAANGGAPHVARRLLEDFQQRFPSSADVAAAQLLAERIQA